MSRDTLSQRVKYNIVLLFTKRATNNLDNRLQIKTRVLKNNEFTLPHIIWKIHRLQRKHPLIKYLPLRSQIFKSNSTILVHLEIASLLKHTMNLQISKFLLLRKLNQSGLELAAPHRSQRLPVYLFPPVRVRLRRLLQEKTNSVTLNLKLALPKYKLSLIGS